MKNFERHEFPSKVIVTIDDFEHSGSAFSDVHERIGLNVEMALNSLSPIFLDGQEIHLRFHFQTK